MTASDTTIVIPCFNAGAWITATIQSILDQTTPGIKIIVIDDGSTDNSLEKIAGFGDRIEWETGANRGAPAARNRGLARVDTTYVMFLDADDRLSPDAIAGHLDASRPTDADIVLGPWRRAWTDGREEDGGHAVLDLESTEEMLTAWLEGEYIPTCSTVWRTAFLREIGGWDETLTGNEDGELVLRALTHGARWAIAKTGYGVYQQHDSPTRVSVQRSPETLRTRLDILARVRSWIGDDANQRLQDACALAHYKLARLCFGVGADQEGRAALETARAMGLTGHPGTAYHSVMASVLGLRRKERLRAAIAAMRPPS